MSKQIALQASLKQFLFKKGFISEAVAELEGFSPAAELGYRAFAEHKLGAPYPFDLPANLEQVHGKILDDEDWQYLEHLEAVDEDAEDKTEVTDDGTDETDEGEDDGAEDDTGGPADGGVNTPDTGAEPAGDDAENDSDADSVDGAGNELPSEPAGEQAGGDDTPEEA